jgi:hypothetical protein
MAKTKLPPERNKELSTNAKTRDRLLEIYKDIQEGFVNQRDRVDDILDYWDAYECKLGERQYYSGTSQIYLPFVYDAVEARQTRFTNQLFPQSGRYVEVTTENGDIPHATMALLEHYVGQAKLRTQIVPALCRSADAEGQMSVYVGWKEIKKTLASRVKKPVKAAGLEQEALGEVEDIDQITIKRGMPDIEVLHDADVLILPATSNSVEEAIAAGGWVVVIRRWTKTKIRDLMKRGDIVEKEGEALIDSMNKATKDDTKDVSKELATDAGIKAKGKFALVYEAWGHLKVEGEERLCRAYFGGESQVLGAKLNPYWCDEVPILSVPVRKLAGVSKGVAPISKVIDMQVFANDTINEGADTAHFAAMPITMTDPDKNPKVGTMIMGLGAVWETSPNDTKFAQFPDLWKSAQERAEAIKVQIFQTLGVNPSMIPQSTGGAKKRNQAEMATEQQVDILTTADAVINIEEGILTPLLQRVAAYDHQFRDKPIMIRSFGEMGLKAQMEEVEPLQMNHRYQFKWFGVEAARNAAMIQQQIAMVNVIKGIPPQMYQGYQLKLAPMIMQMVEAAFGPRLAPLIFEDMAKQISVPPDQENEMLAEGFNLPVHPPDNDAEHMQAHMQAMQAGGDPHGTFRYHLMLHSQQQAQKNMAQQQQQGGLPGAPGGAGPGVAGSPKGGAQAGPSVQKGPPGMIHADRLPAAGAVGMPRKM